MNIKRIYWICLIIFSTSCSNFLNVKEQGKLIPKTTDDYALLLHQILHQIENGESTSVLLSSDNIANFELFADDINANLIVSTSSDYLYAGRAINYNQKYYSDIYSVIKDCNIIIDGVTASTSTDSANNIDSNSNNILGATYTIRAICYYNLMRMYCVSIDNSTINTDLGLQLVDEFNMEEKPPRATLAETIEFIDNDFKTALHHGCNEKSLLFTQNVTAAYYARFNFWTERWQKAIDNALIAIEHYSILPYNDYVKTMSEHSPRSSNIIISSFSKISTHGQLLYNLAKQSIKRRAVSMNLAKLYSISPADDIRRQINFNNKLITTKSVSSKFRSEELYLILAESYAHLNEPSSALKYLNCLRANRLDLGYIPYTTQNLPEVYKQLIQCDALGTQLNPLMSAILVERRMEFFAEGDRWFELKRNGSPEFWVTTDGKKYTNYSYLYTFPIPKRDVELIPNLLKQNYGYEK